MASKMIKVCKLPAERFAAVKILSHPFSNKVRPLVTYWEITFILKGAPAQVPAEWGGGSDSISPRPQIIPHIAAPRPWMVLMSLSSTGASAMPPKAGTRQAPAWHARRPGPEPSASFRCHVFQPFPDGWGDVPAVGMSAGTLQKH